MRATLLFSLLMTCTIVLAQDRNVTIATADSLFLAQRWNEAITAYEKVLKKEPGTALSWNRLGFSYHNLSNYDKALGNYEKALNNKPTPALETVIQSRMVRAYAAKNSLDKSFASLDRAIALGYSNLSELDEHKELENIRKDARFKNYRQRAYVNAYPCMGNEQARQFDFWVGEWDAYVTGTNNLAGHSKIEIASGGCMILENWTSVGGPFSGKSMNFVDPASGKWKQVWVGSNGLNVSEFLNGEYREEAMRFECEMTNPQGVKSQVHFYFFNQGADQIRQFHETSADGGKTWVTTYDFTYKRKKS
ncbi:MAG: tetratricopeptide repeat protein [Cyclobacteriaceae bacterium]